RRAAAGHARRPGEGDHARQPGPLPEPRGPVGAPVPSYELARGLLDPGLFSDNGAKMEEFYGAALGLRFIERLRHSPSYQEVFFDLPPGKLKVQSFAEPMPGPAVTGYRELWLPRDGLREVQRLRDPD